MLQIENVAVIRKAELLFDPGFNVLTGETGAGKSIVIDAIGGVTGQRVSRDLIRSGADSACMRALFTPVAPSVRDYLEENGLPWEDGEVLISREIHADGRSVCRVGGQAVSVSQLRALGALLLSVHGQHDTQQLLSDASHLRYLDRFGRLEEILKTYQQAYRAYRETEAALREMDLDEQEKALRIQQLTDAVEEIEAAAPVPGEDQELAERKKLLQHAETIGLAMQKAVLLLFGDEESSGGLSSVEEAADALEELRDLGGDYTQLSQQLTDLRYELQDAAELVRDLQEQFEYSPGELNEIEERLDVLYKLRRKYGSGTEEILEYLEKARQELEQITGAEERMEQLQKRREETLSAALSAAQALSTARKEAARQLSERMLRELQELDMGKMRFSVELTSHGGQWEETLTESGAESVRFLISANRGEPMKPLSKVASGGELARIMLALKNVLAEGDEVGTLVFDEVDAGVSGRAAQRVAEKLRQLGRTRQVLCVTHLPQMTALAQTHFLIEKGEVAERTETRVDKLDEAGRVRELARMIGGDQITETTLKSAEELLDAGKHFPKEK